MTHRHRRSRRRNAAAKLFTAGPATYVLLSIFVLISVFPLYWSVVVASQDSGAVNDVPPAVVPGARLADNVARVFANPDANFAKGLLNSTIVAGVLTVSVVFFCSLAGFAFAKLRFRGRQALLIAIVATMMVPVQLGIIPLYMLMAKVGWTGRLPSVIVPFLVTGFGVFMMRQYASQVVSDELIEAARVDGCSTFRIYLSVVFPALRPAAAVLGLLTFSMMWNDFLWPLVALNQENPTVQRSLNALATGYYTDYSQVLAGAAVATVPVLVVFVLFGRQILGGLMEGAVKT